MKFPIIAFAAAMLALPALADTPSVLGQWSGRYVCNQGETALRLTISQLPKNRIAADFAFSATRENPEVPSGAYRMEGSYDAATRAIDLKGVTWTQQPFLYVMVDLKGAMDKDGARLAGDVLGPNCSNFVLFRQAPKIS